MTTITTKEMISELALALLGSCASPRAKYVLNQALLALVQLAKSECRVELQQQATMTQLPHGRDSKSSQGREAPRGAATSLLH
jgi:hypothetical protein